ncbi:MAG TPA: universal stress protein [Anaerolineaceae bacterium]|jgi:nucleotide-binding universal stress UspA family protein|nr:universal stress protein [Anaerolineaceae bacterium]HOE34568.1 universal stress protein [Anaerolineaceae bacterium]HOT25018.1 universal stress protein [Anaerolineaceae bacterium]HQH57670.1 universal stress protein [Anaerolineaceae bacterium]HQK03804.1 universal stress protein [Anaerolineaceae bacterium]
MEKDITTYQKALDDFKKARSKAALQRFWAGIRGKSMDLLPYDEISAKLQAFNKVDRGLQTVKVKDIVGSVGRNEDFDRNFSPLNDADIFRWAQVKTAMTSPIGTGVPPVSLYKVGEAYFVLDGNHRVSIARQMGLDEIEAYVTEIYTRVPISASITPEELQHKATYVEFLANTRLDQILPGIDFSLNNTENYPLLAEHIDVHRYYMGIEQKREIPYEEAALDWYEKVYQPVVEMINTSGLREEFLNLTVTDLYLWVLDQQSILQEALGIPIRTAHAAEYMALHEGKTIKPPAAPSEQHFEDTVFTDLPRSFFSPPHALDEPEGCLFRDILVAIGDHDSYWNALEQAILINRCPTGNVRGLHVINPSDTVDEAAHQKMEQRFEQRLQEAGMSGKLLIISGDITTMVSEHSLLSDLLVLRLVFPPSGGILDRLTSGISNILRGARRPILIVKDQPQPLDRLLVVYNGSPKSKEALFVSAYFAGRYGAKLFLFTLDDGTPDLEAETSYAKTYLRKLNLDFEFILRKGDNLAETVLTEAASNSVTALVMGGYSGNSLIDKLFGSNIDTLLRKTSLPVLICQ